MLSVITQIISQFGDDILLNMNRTNAMLLDLAPNMRKERILVRSFVEIDGYKTIKNLHEAYDLAEKKLVMGLCETFSMEKAAALWVTQLFGVALGYLDDMPKNEYISDVIVLNKKVFGYKEGQVSIGNRHVAAVAFDGKVYAGGDNSNYQCDVSHWKDIVAVSSGAAHTLGLRADGTVLAAGSNAYDECDVSSLENVKLVYAFGYDSICVLNDGTAFFTGRSKLNLSEFYDIKSVAPYSEGVIGLKNDGTLTLAGHITEDEMANEIAWLLRCEDVLQVISTHINGSIILKTDGRIYKSNEPENYFAQWRDIRSIVNLADGFAVLNKDGTVRVLAYERDKPRIVSDADNWTDIVQIYSGYKRLIGLTKEGHLKVAYTHMGWLWGNKIMEMDYVKDWYPVGNIEDEN